MLVPRDGQARRDLSHFFDHLHEPSTSSMKEVDKIVAVETQVAEQRAQIAALKRQVSIEKHHGREEETAAELKSMLMERRELVKIAQQSTMVGRQRALIASLRRQLSTEKLLGREEGETAAGLKRLAEMKRMHAQQNTVLVLDAQRKGHQAISQMTTQMLTKASPAGGKDSQFVSRPRKLRRARLQRHQQLGFKSNIVQDDSDPEFDDLVKYVENFDPAGEKLIDDMEVFIFVNFNHI